MTFIRGMIGLAIAGTVVLFAVSNMHTVEFYMTPFHRSLELPFYIIGLGLLGFGFLLGSMMVWINAAPIRRTKRKQRKQIKSLEKEIGTINENAKAKKPPSDFFPALPKSAKK